MPSISRNVRNVEVKRHTLYVVSSMFHEGCSKERKNGIFSRRKDLFRGASYATDCVTRPFHPFHLVCSFVDVVVSRRVFSTSSSTAVFQVHRREPSTTDSRHFRDIIPLACMHLTSPLSFSLQSHLFPSTLSLRF